MDLTQDVKGVSRNPDGTSDVTIDLADDALMPHDVQLLRARAKAMGAVGLIDVASRAGKDVTDALANLSLGDVERATEVVEDRNGEVVIRVKG